LLAVKAVDELVDATEDVLINVKNIINNNGLLDNIVLISIVKK
jgi:hypothetical protein